MVLPVERQTYCCNFFQFCPKRKKGNEKNKNISCFSGFSMCRFYLWLVNHWSLHSPIVINSSISGSLISFIRGRWWLISDSKDHVTALFWLCHFFHALNLPTPEQIAEPQVTFWNRFKVCRSLDCAAYDQMGGSFRLKAWLDSFIW